MGHKVVMWHNSEKKKNPQIVQFSQYYMDLGYVTHVYVEIQVCKMHRTLQAHFPLHQAGSPRAVLSAAPRLSAPTTRPGPGSHFLFHPLILAAQCSISTADHFTISLSQSEGHPNFFVPILGAVSNGKNISHKPSAISS